MSVETKRRKQAGGFADVPFDRMQSVTTISDVGRADVLARGEEIRDALRQERTQRDLKRQRGDIDVVIAAGAGMQINPVITDAEAVEKRLGEPRKIGRIRQRIVTVARLRADV